MEKLDAATGGVILIATPGRLQTHLSKTPSFADRLAMVNTVVLDEVDQLAGELFNQATVSILEAVGASQYLFYSATITEEVMKLINQVSKDHALVDVLDDESTVPEGIVQTYKVVPTEDMNTALWHSVRFAQNEFSPPKIVVIFITGRIAAYYAEAFRQSCDLEIFEIHSRMKQQERTSQSDAFRAAEKGMLFTSDVTSRGLDYPGVTAVIQLGAPDSRHEYVHRVGRTGRAAAEGLGILLLHDFEGEWLVPRMTPDAMGPMPSRLFETFGMGHFQGRTMYPSRGGRKSKMTGNQRKKEKQQREAEAAEAKAVSQKRPRPEEAA
eukprot:symbB.v1.2.004337.t1/scaffold188.1/size279614/26